MDADTLPTRYLGAWQRFVAETRAIHEELRGIARQADSNTDDAPLHALLTRMQWVPYRETHRLFDGDRAPGSANNVGSVAGLFFETAAAAIVIGYVEERVSGVHVERNTCANESAAKVARDPDVHLSFGGRSVVFEVKASPKKRDIEWVRRHRGEYAAIDTRYFLIGGYASLTPADLRALGDERWACFTGASETNRPILQSMASLDLLLQQAVAFLTSDQPAVSQSRA